MVAVGFQFSGHFLWSPRPSLVCPLKRPADAGRGPLLQVWVSLSAGSFSEQHLPLPLVVPAPGVVALSCSYFFSWSFLTVNFHLFSSLYANFKNSKFSRSKKEQSPVSVLLPEPWLLAPDSQETDSQGGILIMPVALDMAPTPPLIRLITMRSPTEGSKCLQGPSGCCVRPLSLQGRGVAGSFCVHWMLMGRKWPAPVLDNRRTAKAFLEEALNSRSCSMGRSISAQVEFTAFQVQTERVCPLIEEDWDPEICNEDTWMDSKETDNYTPGPKFCIPVTATFVLYSPALQGELISVL